MTRKSSQEIAFGLCTVGGAVFALGASKEPLTKLIVLPDLAFNILKIVGGILAVIGAIAFVLSLVVDGIGQAVSQVAYGDLDSRYICTQARPGDLAELREFYAKYFGDDVPSIDLMRAWVSKCASAFTLVQKVVGNSGLSTRQELVGSFKVLPLTTKGICEIELGQVTGSTSVGQAGPTPPCLLEIPE